MIKDRERRFFLADDVTMVYTRTSGHPIEYAIMLIAHRDGNWRTVCTFDNAHAVDEHRYRGDTKQDPIITCGPVNDAMTAALVKLREQWADLVAEWERTR